MIVLKLICNVVDLDGEGQVKMLVTSYAITSKLLLGSHLANKIIVNQFLKCWTTGVGVSAAVISPLLSAYPVIIRTLSNPDDRVASEALWFAFVILNLFHPKSFVSKHVVPPFSI